MALKDHAPVPLTRVRQRAAQRRLSAQVAAESKRAQEPGGGRAWINGREVAPNPGLAHLSLSYD